MEEFVSTGSLQERDKKRCRLLRTLVKKTGNKVIAVTPLSYAGAIIPIISSQDVFSIELTDTPENIFERLVFSDENDVIYKDDDYKNSRKSHYLADIQEDLLWYGSVYQNITNKFLLMVNCQKKLPMKSFIYIILLKTETVMYLRQIKRPQGIYLAIQESYYDSSKKQSRTRTIESIGYLDNLRKEYEDPIAFFSQKAAAMTAEKKKEKSKTIVIDGSEKMDTNTDDILNVGYGILKHLYKELELDKFWNWKSRNLSVEFSVDQIFRLLVFSRILCPASKKGTFDNQNFYFEDFGDFSLDDIYHALDIICKNNEALQKWIFDHSEKLYDRDLSVSYFDCTNYYFDIGRSDMDSFDEKGNCVDKEGNIVDAKYRKRGPEKNHRPDPIVEMGLLMDRNGIPLAFDLFPGNESEKVHMRPIINRIKQDFSNTRIIFVADRGLNTSDNIYYLNGDNKCDVNQRDGYVYGQSVRGADAEFRNWVLASGYKKDTVKTEDGKEIFLSTNPAFIQKNFM